MSSCKKKAVNITKPGLYRNLNGQKVEIVGKITEICSLKSYPWVGWITSDGEYENFNAKGNAEGISCGSCDIVGEWSGFEMEKYLNVYEDSDAAAYDSEKEANGHAADMRVALVKVTYKDGEAESEIIWSADADDLDC